MKKLTQLQYWILTLAVMTSSSLRAGIILTNIFSFNGTNGSSPNILVRAGNNKFYGVTGDGGPNYIGLGNADVGGVFSITSDGVFSNLFFFEGTNGNAGFYLTPGSDGNFYGTTGDTVFKLNPDGTMANPHLAALPSYSQDWGLVQDHDGTLYGTTETGGSSNLGTIYKIDTNGVFSIVTSNGTNTAAPSRLLLGSYDNFYGLAQQNQYAGTEIFGAGSIFRMDRNGNLTNIFLFSDVGDTPSWLVQGSDGDLYALTVFGGTNGFGSISRVTTNGVLVWSFSFSGTNGYGPVALTTASDGNFYGVTASGGGSYTQIGPLAGDGYGTIFRITPNGSFTSLVHFDGTNNYDPTTIVQGTDGNLYGADWQGGTYGLGAIFKLTLPACPTNRLMLTTVAPINGTNFNDFPTVMQGKDGMLYGTTQMDGAFGFGTLFRSTLSGSATTLASFNGTNGAYPFAPLVQTADGNFYGAAGGGPDWNPTANTFGYGTIYRMDSNGVLTTLFSFNGTNGSGRGGIGGLIVGTDGALYGVTEQGGPDFANANGGDGTIFKITTNGDFTMLASFNGADCSYPYDIIQASDGNFYGTALNGGTGDTYGFGAIFQMTPAGQINKLFQFSGTNGTGPVKIMQASDGCLYGTTEQGGAFDYPYGDGTVFKITTNGDFTLLASFDGTNGAQPEGQLVEVCNGVFYGTTENYGGGAGALFQFTTNGDLSALLSFGANPLLPAFPWASLIKASDGNYYGAAQVVTYSNVLYPTAIFCVRPVQAPTLQSVAQGNQLNLNWNAWAGYSYAVIYETNLTGSNWNLLSTVSPQTNGITSYSDPIGPDTQRFYRVVLQLP